MSTPEGLVKQQVIEILLRLDFLVIRLNSGGSHNVPCVLWYMDEFKARRAGVPDLLAFRMRGWPFYCFIDTKATTKPSSEQLEFKDEIERKGGACLFVKSVEDLMAQLEKVTTL